MTVEFHKLLSLKPGTSKRVMLAQTRGDTADEDDDTASDPYDGAESVQPLGLVASPKITPTTEVVITRDGDEIHVLAILDKGGPVHDVESGETQLYASGEPSCRIRLCANGDIEIIAKARQNIIMNGGSKSVGRVDDAVDAAATMSTWIRAITTYVNGIAPGTAILPTNFGTISAGAPNVKA